MHYWQWSVLKGHMTYYLSQVSVSSLQVDILKCAKVSQQLLEKQGKHIKNHYI